jgi:nucleoside-diphosphate-sugar epimerase
MSRSVLITGAAGFIGSHLAERCLDVGWRVTAIDAFTDYYSASLKRENIKTAASHPACTVHEGDLLELDLSPLLAEVDLLFHLAAQPGVRASWDEFDTYARQNVRVTQRVLSAAARASLDRVVLASSSSIYGDAETLPTHESATPRPVSPYGVTKVAAEHLADVYARSFGVPAVWLRYFTVYGPRQRPDMAFNRLIASALSGTPFHVFGDGDQTRDFTFVADVVDGTLAASEHGVPGTAYNIGGGSSRSMNEVFAALAKLLRKPLELSYDKRQVGDARDTAASVERARHELGFEPSVDFEAGLACQLEWQRMTLPAVSSAAS